MKFKQALALFLTFVTFGMIGCTEKENSSANNNSDSSVVEDNTIPEGYIAERENGMMFDEPAGVQIYNYCPSVMVEGNQAHVWYCSSVTQGIGGDDHIAYRHGKKVDGVWYWGPRQIILTHEKYTWYSGNICDPDVIKGEFKYQGQTYTYLMTFLGCTTKDNSSNMFGFKVANNPAGPWVDVKGISPLYDFYEQYPNYEYDPNKNNFIWGWGQSSLISLDKKGKVMLFYTGRSTTGQKYECWDFSDLENPKKLTEKEVTRKGVTDLNGDPDTICNAQFMYDEARHRMYMLCDVHPFRTDMWPTNLPRKTAVYYINIPKSVDKKDMFNYGLTWNKLFDIEESRTGYEHNHNCCFMRDIYGYRLPGNIEVAYTMSETGSNWKVLFTYRIHRYVFND
ncbi:MAG: hypothetical protein IKT32_02660 [Clostridia bacterium]|nr:hypothetical protein [Clostridia bacterium]